MEYFFLFILEYQINGDWMRSRLILPNSAACQMAIRDNERLADSINANLYCEDTKIPSKSIRPRLRPSATREPS